jgi:hypothetical protein
MRRTSEGRTAAVSKAHQSAEGSSGSGDTGALQRRPSVEVESATREPDWCHRSHPPSPPPGARFTTGEPAPRRRRPWVAAVDGCGVEAEAWQRGGPEASKRSAGKRRRVAATIGAGRGGLRRVRRGCEILERVAALSLCVWPLSLIDWGQGYKNRSNFLKFSESVQILKSVDLLSLFQKKLKNKSQQKNM